MISKVNILIFPAGSVNAIEILDSLKFNIHFNVYGASSVHDHSEYVYPNGKLFIEDLYIGNENFLNRLNNLLLTYNIEYIIPTHDMVASYLTERHEEIKANIVCSPYETAKIAENKYLTFKHLKEFSFFPKIYKGLNDIEHYPVFVKPYIGAGGKGAFLVSNGVELMKALSEKTDLIVCEYLPGKEYTVDCFTNKNGELLFIGPRKRDSINIGITFHSERIELSIEIEFIARTLNEKFRFRGAWFFQVKEDSSGKLKLMEFSVRQAGTMALYRQLGVNFAALSLFDAMGYDVKILFNDYLIKLDRCIKPSYKLEYSYDKVYIDLDDTLIIQDRVNTLLIKLIYQCINLKKRVILITKHTEDVNKTLHKYRISNEIFDEIITIKDGNNKSDYIDKSNSIFIDNYFPERVLVKEVCNIPVFDVDAVECLIQDNEI